MVQASKTIVTIGLCTKNSEKTIHDTIRSVTEQDFPHELMEIVIVDGNSQDQTLQIMKQHLSTASIKPTIYSENMGLGFARQMVVDHAKGSYILWVDGDVLLSRSYLKQQVAFMENHLSIGIAIGSFGILTDDNWIATLENIGYVIDCLKHRGKVTSKLIGVGGAIFRVKAARQVGGFNQEIKGAHEDMDIAYRLRNAGWKFYITTAILYHRQRTTWKALWRQQYWYGYGFHFFQSTHKSHNLIFDKAVERTILTSLAYKLTHRKVVFLLPIHFAIKKTVFILGYLSAHITGYGHSASPKTNCTNANGLL